MVRDMAGLLAQLVLHLTHTRAGAQVAVKCIKILDAKHRKKAVRSLKGHVRKIAEDEFGHRVLVAMMEWTDDTKLVDSVISKEIISALKLAGQVGDEEVKVTKSGAVDV